MDIVANIIVGIAVVICIAAGIWVLGFENGWFDKQNSSNNEADPTETNENKESEDEKNV